MRRGQIVTIAQNTSRHRFNIGEQVRCISTYETLKGKWISSFEALDHNDWWSVAPKDYLTIDKIFIQL